MRRMRIGMSAVALLVAGSTLAACGDAGSEKDGSAASAGTGIRAAAAGMRRSVSGPSRREGIDIFRAG